MAFFVLVSEFVSSDFPLPFLRLGAMVFSSLASLSPDIPSLNLPLFRAFTGALPLVPFFPCGILSFCFCEPIVKGSAV